MLRDCHMAIPFAVVHNFSYLPYNNKKDIRIILWHHIVLIGIRTVIVRMEITGHKQGRKMKDSFIAIFLFLHFRSRSRKITVAMSVLVITGKTDVLQEFPVAMAYVPWQQWRKLHDLGYGFQCGTIFQELEKPFRGKGGCCK